MIDEVSEFFSAPSILRSVLLLVVSLIFAFFVSRWLARIIIHFAQFIALRSDTTTDEIKAIKLRRVETYLSVSIALVRVLAVVVIGILTWNLLSPTARDNSSVAAIGASAFFIVLAGGTIGSLLRDITAGATMIAESWFNVGDHIKVEPFIDVAGVVQRVTLRSTKLRALNGEVIWLHNQHIQGVHVTPRGIRNMTVDVLINNEEKGLKLINKVASTIPVQTTLLVKKLRVGPAQPWGDAMWRVRISGGTPPGREWLIEDFFVNLLIEEDKKYKHRIIVHKPMPHYSDPETEKNFRRAVRAEQ